MEGVRSRSVDTGIREASPTELANTPSGRIVLKQWLNRSIDQNAIREGLKAGTGPQCVEGLDGLTRVSSHPVRILIDWELLV